MTLPDWAASAPRVDATTLEIGFDVLESFYHGPANDFTPDEWRRLRTPLYRPAFPMRGRAALSADVAERPEELIRHYEDVLRLLVTHGGDMGRSGYHLALRPILFAGDDLKFTFPWHDTWDEARTVLDAVESAVDGGGYDDIEQGWDLTIHVAGRRLFVRQGDAEFADADDDVRMTRLSAACDRAALVAQVAPLRARCEAILATLRAHLGRDLWTQRPAAGP